MDLRGQGHTSSRLRLRPWIFEANAKVMVFKIKPRPTGLRGQGQRGGFPRLMPWVFEVKAKTKAIGFQNQGQSKHYGCSRSRPRRLAFKAKDKTTGL